MLNTIAKRIQSRLSRSGVKVSLGDIKTQCEQMIKDIQTPTENELLAVQQHFLESATQLTVIPDDVPDVHTSSIQDIEDVHTASIQELDNQEGLAIAPPQTEQPAPLATTNKSELVTATANQMGIVLNATEISLIAENISNSSDDFDQDIDSIKAAIMAFINHKSMINQSKINELINEVREVVSEKNSQNSQLLSDGLKQINSDIQEANRAFKSNVALCITAFDIPALKAG
jgi:transcriptional regulator of acetoin/glycerol metabolism